MQDICGIYLMFHPNLLLFFFNLWDQGYCPSIGIEMVSMGEAHKERRVFSLELKMVQPLIP